MVSSLTAVRLSFMLILMMLILMIYFHRKIVGWNEKLIEARAYHVQQSPDVAGGEDKEDTNSTTNDGPLEHVDIPILLWWTPFTMEEGARRICGDTDCFFTNNRKYRQDPSTKAFLFYGTDFRYSDLPIPRLKHHEWALFHEESPQNNYLFSHDRILDIFNHTATFRRASDLPLTLQYLRDTEELESKEYLVNIREKNKFLREGKVALVNYVQSDCGAPSDRDHFVQMMKRHIEVDALGTCEHNINLPEHLQDPIKGMNHPDFYRLLARYKFTITFENAVCEDYITEKFWRPFKVGSVPIVFGSPKIKDLLPSPGSAIIVSDFTDMADLVQYIKYLDNNDEEYNKYLLHKQTGVSNAKLKSMLKSREWGLNGEPDKPNMVDAFECMVCKRINENLAREKNGQKAVLHRASKEHYGCPKPSKFSDDPKDSLQRVEDRWWGAEWTYSSHIARALRVFLDREIKFTGKQVEILASALEMRNIH